MQQRTLPSFSLHVLGSVGAVLVLGLLQASAGLQQDDYYHLRMAQLLASGEAPRTLVWAKHTVLAQHFADLHFGFHLWLAPFVATLGPMLASKVATVSMATLTLALASCASRSRSAASALLPLLIISVSPAFTLRLLAVRPIALTLAAILLVALLAESRRFVWIAPVAAGLTLSHAAFPLLLLPVLAQAAAAFIHTRHIEWRAFAALSVGVAAGLLAHPGGDALWSMLAVQLFEVGASAQVINTEWASPGARLILEEVWPLLLALATNVWALARTKERAPERVIAWGLMSAASFLLYVFYHRGIDLFVPSACLWLSTTWSWLRPRWPAVTRALLVGAAMILGATHLQSVRAVSHQLATRDLKSCALWLERHSPAGSEVFIADFAAFPQLFFHNRHNVYTLAFDPAFMRAYDPALYRDWIDVVTLRADPYERIHDRFGANLVMLENTLNGRPLYERLRSDARFVIRYQDAYASVFELAPSR